MGDGTGSILPAVCHSRACDLFPEIILGEALTETEFFCQRVIAKPEPSAESVEIDAVNCVLQLELDVELIFRVPFEL